jgi:hypothetical protein
MSAGGTVEMKIQKEHPNSSVESMTFPNYTTIAAVKGVLKENPNDPPIILYLDSYMLQDKWKIRDLALTPDSIVYVRTLHPLLREAVEPRFEPLRHLLPPVPVPQSQVQGFHELEHSEPNPEPTSLVPDGKDIQGDINRLKIWASTADEETIRKVYIENAGCDFETARKLLIESTSV